MYFANARRLRREQTDAERYLWYALRNRSLAGHKFRRQVALGPYIADFACYEARLIVELDGRDHAATVQADFERTAWLNQRGWRVLRLSNSAWLQNQEAMLDAIAAAAASPIDFS